MRRATLRLLIFQSQSCMRELMHGGREGEQAGQTSEVCSEQEDNEAENLDSRRPLSNFGQAPFPIINIVPCNFSPFHH